MFLQLRNRLFQGSLWRNCVKKLIYKLSYGEEVRTVFRDDILHSVTSFKTESIVFELPSRLLVLSSITNICVKSLCRTLSKSEDSFFDHRKYLRRIILSEKMTMINIGLLLYPPTPEHIPTTHSQRLPGQYSVFTINYSHKNIFALIRFNLCRDGTYYHKPKINI